MKERFKKGDIVYIAQEDNVGEYYPEKCEVIGVFDKSLFKDGVEDIYLLGINKWYPNRSWKRKSDIWNIKMCTHTLWYIKLWSKIVWELSLRKRKIRNFIFSMVI